MIIPPRNQLKLFDDEASDDASDRLERVMSNKYPPTGAEYEKMERQARSDFYTALGKHLRGVAAYGLAPEKIPGVMAEYNPDELSIPQLAKYFEIPELESAQRFVAGLLAWRREGGVA